MDIRYKIVLCFFSIVFLIILTRLYFLSVISNDYFQTQAKHNIMRTEMLVPARGQILDRNNKPLAVNNLGYSISLSPYLGKKNAIKTLDEEINKIIALIPNLNFDELKSTYLREYSPYNHNFIVIIRFIPYKDMYKGYTILTQSDNIKITNATKRYYPNNSLASHIIGYIGAANEKDIQLDKSLKFIGLVGKTGLEKYYNDFLQGELGYIKTKVDVLNQTVEVIDTIIAKERHDMTLGIDIELQRQLDIEFEGKSGAAIVMDATTGEILAAGSYPEYNLNYFINGMSDEQWGEIVNNLNNPLLNKMTNGTYPPGSVVKMGVGLSFLEYAGINERTIIETPSYIEVGNRKFRDWTASGHGSSDLTKALRRSVDVYFYKLSQKIGDEKMASILSKMGFGEKTGIDLPNESSGILPTKEWKLTNRGEPWVIGDTIITSIGQGLFLSTPMQVARYTALIATSKLPTPHFAITLGANNTNFPTQDVLSDFQKSKLPHLALGMYQACNSEDGTAYKVTRGSPIPLACKTGTAQVVGIPQDIISRIPEKQMEYYHRSHSWITAFLPYKNPKYVITILVEHGGSAGKVTGPILASLSSKLLELGYIQK